jgi:hypothetical protein
MSKYTPNRWVVLEVNNGKETVNKVFAGWYGGYLDSDFWQLNSGNVAERELDDRWEFDGHSGSTYVCYKQNYGMNGYMSSVLHNWQLALQEGQTMKILDGYTAQENYESL